MSNQPPVEFQPGMELVPGYTLISPLGSGMAGDVWKAQAAGGIKVALKVVRSLSVLGGRKELKALKVIRDVHHPNLCPLFGFWTKDAEGRVLADGETEDLTFDTAGHVPVPGHPSPSAAPPPPAADAGTMAVGAMGDFNEPSLNSPPDQPIIDPFVAREEPPASKPTAEVLIVVMGLGDCTLYDRLRFVRQEAGLAPDSTDVSLGLDAAETIRYLRSSASAIDLLNREHQIYHCDIKPQNILLVGGEAQVCDFGLAKRIEDDMRQTQQAFATPAYAPPEVLHNEGYSRQVDQYSLAVTYFELRTGLLPFDITTHASMLVAKSTGRLNLEALQPAERKVLQKALSRVPNQRYASCSEFVNAMAVASGVDQRGGITAGKIASIAAVFLVAITLGLLTWRFTAPEQFNSFFFTNEVRVADRLAYARGSFEDAKADLFQSSKDSLSNAIELSAEVADQSSGEVFEQSQTLFAEASTVLLQRAHQAMGRVEQSSGELTDQDRDKLAETLTLLGNQTATEQTATENVAVQTALKRWPESKFLPSELSHDRFETLISSAQARHSLLTGSPPSSDALILLRTAIDQRPQDFSDASGITMSLAAMLPALTTMPPDSTKQWTAQQWLQPERLNDLIRAESGVRRYGVDQRYASRWYSTREQFTLAVEPMLVAGNAANSPISAATRQQVLGAFPDLQLEKQLAELRSSVAGLDWVSAERLLGELQNATTLLPLQEQTLRSIRGLVKHREADHPFQEILADWKSSGIALDQLERLRIGGLLDNVFTSVAQRQLRDAGNAQTNLTTEIPIAEQIAAAAKLQVHADLYAAGLVYLLAKEPQIVTNLERLKSLKTDEWLQATDGKSQYTSLRAAWEIEKQLAKEFSEAQALRNAVAQLKTDNDKWLQQVSPSYRDFLCSLSNAIVGEEFQTFAQSLQSASRESITSLGNARLLMGCDRLVKQAVKQSEVQDDDLIQVRYRKRERSSKNDSSPDELLALADFLVSHTDAKENVELSSELFLQRTANATDVVEIPATLNDAVRSSDEIKQLSNQTLLAIHRNAIKRNDEDSAEPAVRAATVLVDRFGTDRFGVLQGASQSKEVLVKQVVMPTLEKVVLPKLVFDKNHLIPSGISNKLDRQSQLVVRFCALASSVLQDQIAKLNYDDPDEHLKDLLAIQAMATKDLSLSADALRPKLDDVAKTLATLPEVDGLLLLNLANQLKQKGCGNLAYDLLKARSLQKQSIAEPNTGKKRQLLETAHQLVSDVAGRLENENDPSEYAALMRYETLANAADLGVQLAFLVQEPQGKESLLLNSAKQIEQALSIYRAQWRGRTVMSLYEAIMTEGNAHEDLGHYVYHSQELDSAEKADQHFEQCFASFRKALQDAPLAMKATTFLGRALYRYSLAKEPRKESALLEEADRVLGDSPTDLRTPSETVRTEQSVKWCLWRLQVDAKLNKVKSGLRTAELAMDLISKNELPMDLATDAAYHSGIAHGIAKDWEQAVRCFSFHGNDGDINNIVYRAGALTDIAFKRNPPSNLLFQDVLRMFKHASELATQGQRVDKDGAYHSAKVAMRCTVELANERNSGLTHRATTCNRSELSSGVTDFATLIKGQSPPEYADLGPIYVNCGNACDKGDHQDLLTSACDLAQQLNDSTVYSDFFLAANLRIVQLMVESGDQAMMANGLSINQRNAQYASERKQILSRMSKRILDSPSLNRHGALRDSANTMIKFLDDVP